MLRPYRVLDLTRTRGHLCGQILADLGADVVQVEPPGGSPVRGRGPFVDDVPHPDRSLQWWATNRNKRGITLDLDVPRGRTVLRRLVARADFLIESETPGVQAARGLDYDALAAVQPRLVYVSISPFGQTGPKATWADSDLVLMASGGPLRLTGDEDRAPLRLGVPQAYAHAAAEAAAAALVAHHERARSGRGQHVDVSAQQAVTIATQSYLLSAAVGFPDARRIAGGVGIGPLSVRFVYPAADGHVSITFLFGSSVGPFTQRLMRWIAEEGGCDAAMRDKDWVRFFDLMMTGDESLNELVRAQEVVAAFTRTKTKAVLLEAALAKRPLDRAGRNHARGRRQPAARGPRLLADDRASRARPRRAPSRSVRALLRDADSPAPTPADGRRAQPRDLRRRARHRRRGARGAERRGRHLMADAALADVKVLDLMWAIAGPAATRMLADYGATVVRVESTTRTDICRTVAPFHELPPGPESAVLFHNMNAGKRMITLDLATSAGRAVLLDLVRWADVVAEAYTAGTMRTLGLDYEALRTVNPAIIMLSTCLMGQTGPLARYAGFGNLAHSITGFGALCGWPDRTPAGPFGAYTDYIAPRFSTCAILAALDHRRRTGEGQHIDLAQAEASIHFLTPAMLDYTVNGRTWTAAGNTDPDAAPHGVYPAAGDDRWLALAVHDDAQFAALATVLGTPELARDPRFASADARRAHAETLDATIAAWTAARAAHTAEAALQSAGVPAAVVAGSEDLCRDPQLVHRGHVRQLTHPTYGTTPVEGSRARLSRTPAVVDGPAPTLGRDNQDVLETILGYDADRIADLVVAGALG